MDETGIPWALALGSVKDSLDLDNSYDTEEEAQEEAQADIDDYMESWDLEESEYEKELFEIVIE